MAGTAKIEEFPDISSKLTAPTKKSIFERQKAEAEAKRQREQAETAAVYEDFVKSFEDQDEPGVSSGGGLRAGPGGVSGTTGAGPGFGGLSKRHFTGPPTGPAAGRGLGGPRGGSGPGSLGLPPPSLSRKRARDGTQAPPRDGAQGLFAFENSSVGPVDAAAAFQTSDDEDDKVVSGQPRERIAPKPTLHLSSLPPGTSPALIKSLFPSSMTIDAVRMLPPPSVATLERRSFSAIVTLAKDTPANDTEAAVNTLQNRYLGWGFYLTLSRHLSSAALTAGAPVVGGTISATSSLPFGAKPIPTGPGGGLNRAPPPGSHRGGFAPPSSYAPTGPAQFGRGGPPVQVNVNPPSNLKQLKLIHKTLEALLTHGPEFEALLMSRANVQREEKWAWLWDPRSAGGVWYRWRLWQILTGSQSGSGYGRSQNQRMPQHVFDGGATWLVPEKGLRFEYTTGLDEFVSDSEYDSSEDEDSADEGGRQHHHHRGGPPPSDAHPTGVDGDGRAYLNPLQKAKLTHLLARLPTTNAKLRKGDVARVTAFAIEHAGEGADEVVDLIVSNIEQPLNFTSANTDRPEAETSDRDDDDATDSKDRASKEKPDTTPSKLIALYLVSDILSSSSTSGVRHAWRYRQLFESALKQRRVFEHLGRLDKQMHWGRLRAEKWKRSVGSVLALWEGWCVFPQASQEHFGAVFANPPLTREEEVALAEAEKSEAQAAEKARSRWKTVDVQARLQVGPRPDLKVEVEVEGVGGEEGEMDIDGEPMEEEDENEDVDGEPMDDDTDVDGEPMEEEGEEEPTNGHEGSDRVVDRSEDKRTDPPDEGANILNTDNNGTGDASKPTDKTLGKRRRPKAEDMFADSDED